MLRLRRFWPTLPTEGDFVSKITVQSLIFLIGISGKKDIKQYVLTRNYKIMFEFQLQDIQQKIHYIPNWNFMLKQGRC